MNALSLDRPSKTVKVNSIKDLKKDLEVQVRLVWSPQLYIYLVQLGNLLKLIAHVITAFVKASRFMVLIGQIRPVVIIGSVNIVIPN